MFGGLTQEELIRQQESARIMEESLQELLSEMDSEGTSGGQPVLYRKQRDDMGLAGKLPHLPRDVVYALATSTAAHALYFYPDHFTRPFSFIHTTIFQHLDTPTLYRTLLAAPRGYGKTTITELAYISRIACFGLEPFILLVSATATQAEKYLATLKYELESNDRIKQCFGDVKGPVWASDQIVLSNGVCIMVRGAGQQVRGLKWRQFRPTVILCDDLEDKEKVQSEEGRKKLKAWFYSDLMRAGHETGKACKIIFIGTVLHQDALLVNVMQDKRWKSVRLEAFNEQRKSIDQAFLTDAEVEDLYLEYQENGMLDVLYMEYRNLAIAPENRIFPLQYHRYYPGDAIYMQVLEGIRAGTLATCVLGDPAKTSTGTSDFYALVGIAIDFLHGIVFIHEVSSKRSDPYTFLVDAMDMADRLGTNKLFIETTSLHDWLLTVVRTVMMQRLASGKPKIYDVTEIHATAMAKLERIGRLAPLYKAGSIMHNAECCTELEGQLIDYPKAKKDDISDCSAIMIPVISQSGGWNYGNIDELFKIPQWVLNRSAQESDNFETINQSEFCAV